jgi:hypothetical protein
MPPLDLSFFFVERATNGDDREKRGGKILCVSLCPFYTDDDGVMSRKTREDLGNAAKLERNEKCKMVGKRQCCAFSH